MICRFQRAKQILFRNHRMNRTGNRPRQGGISISRIVLGIVRQEQSPVVLLPVISRRPLKRIIRHWAIGSRRINESVAVLFLIDRIQKQFFVTHLSLVFD